MSARHTRLKKDQKAPQCLWYLGLRQVERKKRVTAKEAGGMEMAEGAESSMAT